MDQACGAGRSVGWCKVKLIMLSVFCITLAVCYLVFQTGRLSVVLDRGLEPDYKAKYEACTADMLALIPPPQKTK